MNYAQLRDLADQRAQIWGFINGGVQPNWGDLVNRANRFMAWKTEIFHGPYVSITSVANQAEYTLPTLPTYPEWKSLLDVIYITSPLTRTNEHNIRRVYPAFLQQASGTPTNYWSPRPGILRLFPPPSASGDTVLVYGIRGAVPLVADTDTPAIPDVYHEGIAIYAAFLHIDKYAKGEARQRLGELLQEYQQFEDDLKQEQAERVGLDAFLLREAPEAERTLT